MRIGSLCSGYEGIFLALRQVFPGAGLAFTAETDPAASAVLAHNFPSVPNLGDVSRIDWGGDANGPLAVDILTAGFP